MKILVPTDFSISSYNAFITAKKFAKASNGTILLMHVIESPSASFSVMGEGIENGMDDVFVAKLMKKITSEMKALKEANTDVEIEIHRKVGDPFKEIKDVIQWEKVDLVVMGEKGVSELDDLFIGSLTDKVVRASNFPVLTVNQEIDAEKIETLLYATDLEEDHPKLIKLLKNFQQIFNAKLHIVRVNTRSNFISDVEAMVLLHKLVDKYQIENYELKIYNHEDEEAGIVIYAEDIKADLIAIGIHHKTGIRRLIAGGDLAENVADHTHRPVLTFHFDA